jgi:hypothetical protein
MALGVAQNTSYTHLFFLAHGASLWPKSASGPCRSVGPLSSFPSRLVQSNRRPLSLASSWCRRSNPRALGASAARRSNRQHDRPGGLRRSAAPKLLPARLRPWRPATCRPAPLPQAAKPPSRQAATAQAAKRAPRLGAARAKPRSQDTGRCPPA